MTFTPVTLGTGLSGYNYLARTRDVQQALFDQNPLTKREVERATEGLKNVQTSQELMDDRVLLTVALGAFGLDEDINNRAFIQRILDSDLEDDRSLANRLSDKRYLAFAESFNFNGAEGPQLPDRRGRDELTLSMEGLKTSDDLLSDRSLLRASLERFGLQDNLQNTYFLKEVLDSDLSDPTSFANSFGDDRLVEFAQAFDFQQKEFERDQSKSRVEEISKIFSTALPDIETTEDLLAQPELLEEALSIFGLDDIYTEDFLRDVLNSDLFETGSFANTQTDERFAAFSAAFNFTTPLRDDVGNVFLDDAGDIVFKTGNIEVFLDEVSSQSDLPASAEDLLANRPLREATFDLLGIPKTTAARNLAQRVFDSDPNDPISFAEVFPDPRYSALSDLFTFEPEETTRTYPEGFVDQVVRNYLDRQFEIRVGDVDPDMRVALSLDRELNQVVRNSPSNDAQWFSIMASPPLRQVFESAFRLPSGFGSIDIDQQLSVLKDRSQQFFGTSEVQDFIVPETMDTLRQNYLVARSTQTFGGSSGANIASIILSSF